MRIRGIVATELTIDYSYIMANEKSMMFRNIPPKNEPIVDPFATGTDQNPIVVKPEKPYEKPSDVVTWESHERVFSHQKPVWFVSLFAITGAIVLSLALLQQWSFALALVGFAVVMFIMNVVEPGNQMYRITTTGIKIAEKRFGYEDLKWFWFGESENHDVLYVATYLNFPHVLELPLLHTPEENTQLKEQIETELLKYLPYHEEGQRNWMNTFDKIISWVSPWLPKSIVEWYGQKTSNR